MQDPTAQINLSNACKSISEKQIGVPVTSVSASTDCNVPLSLGIPSVAVGVWKGHGCHTREEYLEIESLKPGFRVAVELMKFFL
jgi:di/tripeptidase